MGNTQRRKDWTGLPNALNNVARAERLPGEPRFLLPKSRQFPFDEAVELIVKRLKEREFEVPGISVKFYSYGPSNSYEMIESIEGEDFRLRMGRIQGRADSNFNDVAAVSDLFIPGKELNVYHDNSGPTFYLYVGNDWERDKEGFTHSTKVHSKLRGEPRTYLRYTGSCRKDGRSYFVGRTSPFLVHDNDLGREYDPKPGEPKLFNTNEVFEEFTKFLQGKLEQIFK